MAFKKNNFSMAGAGVIGDINCFNYTTEDDDIDTVSAAGYLTTAKEFGMNVGDPIFIRDSTGTTGQRQCTAIAADGSATLGDLI